MFVDGVGEHGAKSRHRAVRHQRGTAVGAVRRGRQNPPGTGLAAGNAESAVDATGPERPIILCAFGNHSPRHPAAYVIALVTLDEQDDLRLATNIVDCEPNSVFIGMPVEVRFECEDATPEPVLVPVFAPRLG